MEDLSGDACGLYVWLLVDVDGFDVDVIDVIGTDVDGTDVDGTDDVFCSVIVLL